MEIKHIQAKCKVNALPSDCLLNIYKIYYSVLCEVHTKKSFTYIFSFFWKMYCLFWTCFEFLGSSDCDDDVSGLADFIISS